MNVYLRIEDGIELVGRTSLVDPSSDDYVVDIDIAGTGEVMRLAFDLRSVPCMTADGHLGEERAVLISLGQIPDFLPGWEALDTDGDDPEDFIRQVLRREEDGPGRPAVHDPRA